MSNIFKKITSASMAMLIVLSIVSPFSGVMAAYSTLESANKLAALGVIVDNSANPANYRLGDSITRGEMAKVTMKLSETEVADMCEGKFSDLKASDWACKYAEAGLANGYFAANATFRPMDVVTKIEALKMVMQARGVAKSSNSDWMAAYVEAGVEAGILDAAFTDYNTVAQRGWIFQTAVNAVEGMEEDDDLLGDLLGDLDDEDTDTDTNTDTDTDTDTPVVGGDLEVSLSPETPVGADLPKLAEGVAVAKFDFTAGDSDVTVTSVKLTRKGLGAAAALDNVALFVDEARASKAKTFNSSSDTADVVLSPALVIKAGETVTLTAKVNTKAALGTFAVELTDVVSDGNVTGGVVIGNSFEVKDTTATAITLSDDGTVSNPKLGAEQVDLMKFKIKNNTTTNEDVTLTEITFKEDGTIDEETELTNLALYYEGSEVAKVETMSSKYVTFALTSPVTVKPGNTAKFVVKGDIIGGAGDTVSFILDNDLDVTATSSKYGYVSVTDSIAANIVTVQAGEITLVQVDPTSTETRKDKDDVILGKITVVSKAGKALELEKIKVTIANIGVAANVSALLENIELYDEVGGTVYDLPLTSAAGVSETYADEVNITIPSSGELTLAIRADTLDVAGVATAKFQASVNYDSSTFVIKETEDDKIVSDVNPSSITFKPVTGTTSSLTINTVAMSTTKSAVIGSKEIEVLTFELKSDNDSTDLTVDELKVKGIVVDHSSTVQENTVTPTVVNAAASQTDTVTINGTAIAFVSDATPTVAEITAGLVAAINLSAEAGVVTATDNTTSLTIKADAPYDTFTVAVSANLANSSVVAAANDGTDTVVSNSRLSALYLYNGDTLIDTVGASNIAAGIATFDGFNVKIAKNSSQRFIVKADILDAAANANDTMKFNLNAYSVEDDDSDDVFSSTPVDADGILADTDVQSARLVTIKGAGTLAVAVDNTDTETSNAKNILGNVTSPFVASYELTATNEGIKVKDFTLSETSGSALANAVSEVIIYANDKTTELARKTVSSDTLNFDNVNFIVEEGSENIYVKVVASKQGKDAAGVQTADLTLTLLITDAEGDSSSKTVTNPAVTLASNAFSVNPVKVSALSMVQSGGGASLASTLSNGTSQVLGIIAITTDSSTNTDSTDGSSLKTELQSVTATIEGGLAIADMKITRVNGSDTDGVDGTTTAGDLAAGADTMVFPLASLTNEDNLVDNGTTVYFKIEGKPTLTATDSESVAVKLIGLNGGSLTYSSDDAVANNAVVGALRLGYTEVSGISIKE